LLPLDVSEHCLKVFSSTKVSQSRLQTDVARALQSIGVACKEEAILNSGYSIDLLVSINEKEIAIEVDGPSHFIGRSKKPNGKTRLKHRQIRALDNLKVVSVPYWELHAIEEKFKGDKLKGYAKYLQKLLD